MKRKRVFQKRTIEWDVISRIQSFFDNEHKKRSRMKIVFPLNWQHFKEKKYWVNAPRSDELFSCFRKILRSCCFENAHLSRWLYDLFFARGLLFAFCHIQIVSLTIYFSGLFEQRTRATKSKQRKITEFN